jgi:uncharacterized protein
MNKSGRIVFDTSTLVSAALRASSAAERAVSLTLRNGVVCVCEQSMEQMRAALTKSKLDRYMGKRARMAFADVLLRNAWICPVSKADVSKVRHAGRDRRNNMVLALAAIAEADAIISSEPALLARKTWRGIPIVAPAEFEAGVHPA